MRVCHFLKVNDRKSRKAGTAWRATAQNILAACGSSLLRAERILAGFGRSKLASCDVSSGEAAFFFGDGFGIDEPLAVAGAAGLFFLGARQAAEAEQAADFGAGRIHYDSSLLGGEPVGEILRHGYVTLAVSLSGFNSTDKDSYTIY